MQTTEDGEYIPSKELDMNFKIPKKKDVSAKESKRQPMVPAQVLEYSEHNYTDYMHYTGDYTAQQSPVVSTQQFIMEPTQNLIVQALHQQGYEKPKTYGNHILMDTIPDCFDETLPRDLIAMFQPLYCKLCAAQLSSNIVARLHYKSKNHEKKVRKFLIDYADRTGEPVHKRARLSGPMAAGNAANVGKEGAADTVNPMYFYCDVCDLPLTGKLHAESHYMGKNHRKATLGVKSPAGKGHYDANGRWIRESSGQKRPLNTSLDDTFGRDFRTPVLEPSPEHMAPPSQPSSMGFRCELCNITTTCQEQLESHFNGQKHRKKQKQQNIEVLASVLPGGIPPQDNILTSVLMADPDKGDCSVYRTPSGSYYCQICNISTNSEPQFKHHLQSKNHLKKASQNRH